MVTVNVRVWTARQGDRGVEVDPAAVMDRVARIWATAGVELRLQAPVHEVTLSPVPERADASAPSLMDSVPAGLKDAINAEIARNRVGWIDLVLTPVFGRLGQAYTPLTFLVANKRNAYDPFTGPVAIVATERDQTGGAISTVRKEAVTPEDGDPSELVEIGVAYDAAHEIGHLFGLWHTADVNPKLRMAGKPLPQGIEELMYTTLYNDAGRSRADVYRYGRKDFVTAGAEKSLVLGRKGDSFVLLRGTALVPKEIAYAAANAAGPAWE